MTDAKMAQLFFILGVVLTLFSCVLGPIGEKEWSIACAVVAGFMALGGIYLALGSWYQDDEPKNKEPSEEEQK